jgi:branched-chain amino acid transport system substrate-binding protein
MAHDAQASGLARAGRRGLSKKIAVLGTLAALSVSFLSACGGSGSSGGSDETGDFTVGVIRPTSGVLASSYKPLYLNLEMAIKEINADGGIMGRKVVPQYVDDEGSPAGQSKALRTLQSKGIKYVFGPTGDSLATAALPLLSADKIIGGGWYAGTELMDTAKYPYAFLPYFDTTQEANEMAKFMVTDLGKKKIGFLSEATSLGPAIGKPLKVKVTELGGKIVSEQEYPLDTASFVTAMNKLKADGVDGIVATFSNVPNTTAAYQAMEQLKWYPPLVTHYNFFPQVINAKWSKQLTDSIYAVNLASYSYPADGKPDPAVDAYVTKLREIKGFDASGLPSAPFYDMLNILKKTIEAEKTFDVEKVQAALNKVTDYPGMNGKVTFTKDNHLGISDDQVTTVSMASGHDPRSNGGFFFEKAAK